MSADRYKHLTRLLGDQSTAPLDEKLRRFLKHLMNPDGVYFYDDGYPRQHLYQQAALFFRLIEAGALTVGVTVPREPLPAETAQPMFGSHVGRRKWEQLQGDGYRMQRIHFARSVDGHERRGTIDPWGKVLWEPAGVGEVRHG